MGASRRWALAVVAALVALLPVAPAGAVGGFGDVRGDAFYADAVQWMVDLGVTSGTSEGCFSPTDSTTRGQVSTFIHRVHGAPAGGAEPFVDVRGDDFFAEAVAWMVDAGITTGTSATTFSPHRPVTRGELAAFLWRAEGAPAGGDESFVDVRGDDFFAEAVAWMVGAGITTGTSATTFSPYRAVTRGEVATFLYRVAGSPAVAMEPGGHCPSAEDLSELDLAEARSFALLNELRVGLGLDALERDPVMDAAARDWSATMDRTGDFRHSALPYGENIAWWSWGRAAPDAAARTMHDLWVDSPGHYANMTRASYDRVGVGFWRSDDGGWHATHVFS